MFVVTTAEKARAAAATLAHFRDRPFDWGRYDCAKMLAFHLRQLGIVSPLARAGSYRTAIGAKRALRRLGVETLPELLDRYFPRLPAPAWAVTGDIVSGEGDVPFGTAGIVLGNRAILGYSEDRPGAAPLRSNPEHLDIAWRV